MNVSMDTTVNFADQKILSFLAQPHAGSASLSLQGPTPAGFYRADARPNPNNGASSACRAVSYTVRESWAVLDKKHQTVAEFDIDVPTVQDVAVSATHVLFIADNVNAETRARTCDVFRRFDPNVDGDMLAWITANRPAALADSQWLVETEPELRTLGPARPDTSQRDSLLYLYGVAAEPRIKSRFFVDPMRTGEQEMRDYIADAGFTLRQTGTAVAPETTPIRSPLCHDVAADAVPGAADAAAWPSILDTVVEEVVPSECGPVTPRSQPIAQIDGWPEFMVKFWPVSIKIGCATITISLPVLHTRTSTAILHAYWAEPADLDKYVGVSARSCLLRAVVAPEVLGTAFVAPPVALGAFLKRFGLCMAEDYFECAHPGLAVVFEVGKWTPPA